MADSASTPRPDVRIRVDIGGTEGATLVTGGREMSVAKKSTGALAYTTLDESLPRLDVQYLGS